MDSRCVGCKGFPSCDPDDCAILKLREARPGDVVKTSSAEMDLLLGTPDPDPEGGAAPATPAAYPDNNPKTILGLAKPSISCAPPSAMIHMGRAMADGKKKYGLMNWREKTVSTSVYYDAAWRHLNAFWDGEDCAKDSGVHHLGHVMACCAIILDAKAQGSLNDDRPVPGKFAELCAQFTKPLPAVAQ